MAEGVIETVLYILGIGVVIFLLSMLFKEKRIILPLITSLLSIIVFIVSFFVSNWGGLGLAYMSFNAFTASVINLFILTIINKSKNKEKPGS
ncbi:YesK family protein [Oceanobacillus jeddahense]|uniref:YesK family protein n=1 Tax=Oceanobacillus jeddahense TaxID=1462527 RepID=UPI000595AF03|nr:YesK family protein [Oceanobacillus jeddahense]